MNQAGSQSSHVGTHRDEQTKVEGKVKDPVCGMDVDPARAAANREFNSQLFYFCAAGCAVKFDADPALYAKSSKEGGDARGCCG